MSRRSTSDTIDPPGGELDDAGSYDDDEYDYRYRRSWFQRLVILLGILAVMACLAVVAFIGKEALDISEIERKDVSLAASSDDEPQNWLIVGSDSRDVISHNDPNSAVFTGGGDTTGGQRSDTIMIVRIDPKAEHLDVLSLQRDLWLPIARTNGSERINTAYSYPDGPQRLIDTIKQNFDIDINHYVEINFASFEGIVNAVGGLPLYFDKPMRDNNSGLEIDKPGCVTLDGYQALAFARSRHLQYSDGVKWINDESADLGRISRQQFFMRKMFDRAASKAFSSPQTLNELIGVAKDNVGLDKQIDVTKAVAMAQRFGQFKGDSIKSYSLPVTPTTKASGAQVLELEPGGAAPILATFRGLPATDVDPSTVKFTVENGSGVAGQAGEVQKAFQAIGYGASGATDHSSQIPRTIVNYAPGQEKVADQIARHLTNGADLVADPTLASGKIVLVTGTDFTTVMRRPRDPATTGTTVPGDATTTTAAAGGKSTTTSKGQKAASTTSTTAAPSGSNNDGTNVVGVVPGQAPDGVNCG